MKRLLWLAVGVAGSVAAARTAREVVETHVPAGARGALGAADGLTTLARRAAAEFRAGSAEREAELRAELLAGADLPSARVRLDAWRAERAAAKAEGSATGTAVPGGPGGTAGRADRTTEPAGPARPGSAAAAPRRPSGAHAAQRPEDPDDGDLGYSF